MQTGQRWVTAEGRALSSLCMEDEKTGSAVPRGVLTSLPVDSGRDNKPKQSGPALGPRLLGPPRLLWQAVGLLRHGETVRWGCTQWLQELVRREGWGPQGWEGQEERDGRH